MSSSYEFLSYKAFLNEWLKTRLKKAVILEIALRNTIQKYFFNANDF